MLNNFPISLGTTAAKLGGGSGAAQLTTSYTPAVQVRTAGIGSISHACTVGIGGSTGTYFRLMDYSDPSNPRQLLSTVPNDGLGNVVEHVVSSAGVFELQAQLGGPYTVTAIEVKGTGMLTSSDTFTALGTGMAAS